MKLYLTCKFRLCTVDDLYIHWRKINIAITYVIIFSPIVNLSYDNL